MVAADLPPGVPGERTTVRTNGVELHCVEAGNPDGDLIVLLHGFPEFWFGWHEAIAPLASDGYHVVVPDQRGYNRSEKPDGVAAYRVEELVADVAGLVERFDDGAAHVVGHDLGGCVAWWLAMERPELVSHLVAVNAPHPGVIEENLPSLGLLARNWHVLAAQVPWLPEFVCRRRNWKLLCRTMERSSATGTFTPEDYERYRRAWSRSGAFPAMLNWHRAMVRYRPEVPEDDVVEVPTRVVWGKADSFLPWHLGRQSADRCTDSALALVDDATHWVHHEFPARVVDEIREHVAPPGTM